MFQHTPSKAEVLAAVERCSVLRRVTTDEVTPRIATANDVAEYIYTQHHGQLVQRTYESRTSNLRKGVAVSRVKTHLETLVEEGAIAAVSGTHWFARTQRGITEKTRGYVSKEAIALAVVERKGKQRRAFEADCQRYAEQEILSQYADEVKKAFERHADQDLPDLGW